MKLDLEIITPQKSVYKDTVDEVVVPTPDGEIAILPNHINLLTKIAPGELFVKKNSNIQSLAITDGYMDVVNNKITILANYAIVAEDIQIAKAEEAKKQALKIMEEKISEKDFKIAQGELLKSLLEIKVAQRRKKHRI